MLKIERDKLLMTVVLILVISMDILNTSMLASLLPRIPNVIPFLGVRFLYVKEYSLTFLIFAPLLFLVGCMIYFKTGNLNASTFIVLIYCSLQGRI